MPSSLSTLITRALNTSLWIHFFAYIILPLVAVGSMVFAVAPHLLAVDGNLAQTLEDLIWIQWGSLCVAIVTVLIIVGIYKRNTWAYKGLFLYSSILILAPALLVILKTYDVGTSNWLLWIAIFGFIFCAHIKNFMQQKTLFISASNDQAKKTIADHTPVAHSISLPSLNNMQRNILAVFIPLIILVLGLRIASQVSYSVFQWSVTGNVWAISLGAMALSLFVLFNEKKSDSRIFTKTIMTFLAWILCIFSGSGILGFVVNFHDEASGWILMWFVLTFILSVGHVVESRKPETKTK